PSWCRAAHAAGVRRRPRRSLLASQAPPERRRGGKRRLERVAVASDDQTFEAVEGGAELHQRAPERRPVGERDVTPELRPAGGDPRRVPIAAARVVEDAAPRDPCLAEGGD